MPDHEYRQNGNSPAGGSALRVLATRRLRRVGKSTMVAIPPAILKQLGMSAGDRVRLTTEEDRIVIRKSTRPHYSIEELIARCDFSQPLSDDEIMWANLPSVGEEIIE